MSRRRDMLRGPIRLLVFEFDPPPGRDREHELYSRSSDRAVPSHSCFGACYEHSQRSGGRFAIGASLETSRCLRQHRRSAAASIEPKTASTQRSSIDRTHVRRLRERAPGQLPRGRRCSSPVAEPRCPRRKDRASRRVGSGVRVTRGLAPSSRRRRGRHRRGAAGLDPVGRLHVPGPRADVSYSPRRRLALSRRSPGPTVALRHARPRLAAITRRPTGGAEAPSPPPVSGLGRGIPPGAETPGRSRGAIAAFRPWPQTRTGIPEDREPQEVDSLRTSLQSAAWQVGSRALLKGAAPGKLCNAPSRAVYANRIRPRTRMGHKPPRRDECLPATMTS